VDHECEEMTMNEIINGTVSFVAGDIEPIDTDPANPPLYSQGHGFPGLLGVVNAYLNSLNVDIVTKCELRRYLELVKRRAQGGNSLFCSLGSVDADRHADRFQALSVRLRPGYETSSSITRRTSTTRLSATKSITTS
jgi:hypothetical protein